MYDIIIIGGGWAGYNAALYAKSKNLKVALVEKTALGGTCLNKGCIPTKTLIQSAKLFSFLKKLNTFGINAAEININLGQILERENKIIKQLSAGMDFRVKGVDLFISKTAKIIDKASVGIGCETLSTRYILICTGSEIFSINGLEIDHKKLITSDDILQLNELPKSLLVVGGGVIGCEFASLFNNLGVQVTIVEMLPRLLNNIDFEVARKLEVIFNKKNIKVYTSTDYKSLDLNSYDKILVAVGRKANVKDLGLEELKIEFDKKGICVDENLKTNIDNIYAAGDCTGKLMLAHFAAYQGRLAVKHMFDIKEDDGLMQLAVPNCIFTDPEISQVGSAEDEVKNLFPVKTYKFDFLGSGMARIIDETEGFIKIVTHADTKVIVGASIIGPKATELISILTVAVNMKLQVNQLKNFIFPHPTLSEAIIDTLNKE